MKQRTYINRAPGFIVCLVLIAGCPWLVAQTPEAPLFSVHEVGLSATDSYANPYQELEAEVVLTPPEESANRAAPLFWDGGATWKFRFSPDRIGEWRWTVRSRDPGLDGQTGRFRCVPSDRRGSIRPMRGFPRHFERQDGSPFWFMGDTAWALYTDNESEKHERATAERYLKARRQQGFKENRPWEAQMGHMERLFTRLHWWKLESHDELLRCDIPRGSDRRHLNRVAPPETAYWCLAEPGRR